jgi:hypothetical protein
MVVLLVLVEVLALGRCNDFTICRRNIIDELVGGIFPHASAWLLGLTLLA